MPVKFADVVDVSFPDAKELLDVRGLGQGLPQCDDKLIWLGEALTRPIGKAEQLRPAIVICTWYKRLAVFHAGELAIVECEPKGIAEGRECSFGGIRFGGLESEFVRFTRGERLRLAASAAFSEATAASMPSTFMRT